MQPCRRTTLPSVSSSALLLFAQGAATCLSSATGTSSRAAAPTAAPATSPASPAPRARTPATPSARPIPHPASATRSATTPRHPAVLRKPAGSRWAQPLPDDSPRWAAFSHRCAAPQFTAVPVADMRGSMEQDAYFRVQKTAANGTVVESKYYENYACTQQEPPSHSLRSPPRPSQQAEEACCVQTRRGPSRARIRYPRAASRPTRSSRTSSTQTSWSRSVFSPQPLASLLAPTRTVCSAGLCCWHSLALADCCLGFRGQRAWWASELQREGLMSLDLPSHPATTDGTTLRHMATHGIIRESHAPLCAL